MLDLGSKLIQTFNKLQHLVRIIYTRLVQDTERVVIHEINSEIYQVLQEFDQQWASFEEVLSFRRSTSSS